MKRLALALLLLLAACISNDPTVQGTAPGAAGTFTIQTEAGLAVCVTYKESSGSAVACTWPDR